MADRVAEVLDRFLAAADQTLAGRYSALLYGSAARGDYFDQTSDINLLLVLDDVAPATLRTLRPAFQGWRDATPEPPLVISRAEWARATDVFPLEITDMLAAYRLLRGDDPLAGVQVSRGDLRRALESELRGKLLRLRQGFTLLSGDPEELGAIASSTVPTALVLLRALLVLEHRPVSPASDAEHTVREAARVAGFAPEPLLEIVRHRGQRRWRCDAAVFEGYVEAIERTARYVDQLHPGDD